jgi:site-specific DNA-cytosine methylase
MVFRRSRTGCLFDPVLDPIDQDHTEVDDIASLLDPVAELDTVSGAAPSSEVVDGEAPAGEFSGSAVDIMTTSMLKQLSTSHRSALKRSLQQLRGLAGEELLIGSLCSGTDLIVPCFKQMMARLQSVLGIEEPMRVRHVFSVEFNAAKRKWIEENFRPEFLFESVTDLNQPTVKDLLSQTEVPVPYAHFVWAGFSCKNLSKLNEHQMLFQNCLVTGQGSTGKTYFGIMSYLKKHRPLIMFLENVRALLGTNKSRDNIMALIRDAASLGYLVLYICVDAAAYGLPQQRLRAWLSLVKISHDAILPMNLKQELDLTMTSMRCLSPPNLEDMFFAEGSDDYIFWAKHVLSATKKQGKARRVRQCKLKPRWRLQRKMHLLSTRARPGSAPARNKGKNRGSKWPVQHKAAFERQGLRWPPVGDVDPKNEFTSSCLPDRSREMLMYDEALFPRSELGSRRIVSLGQTIGRMRGTSGIINCIYPQAGYWERKAQRPVFGAELLRAQGLATEMAPAIRSFGDRFLGVLAGNAFSAAAAIPWAIATLAKVPWPGSLHGPVASSPLLERSAVGACKQLRKKTPLA